MSDADRPTPLAQWLARENERPRRWLAVYALLLAVQIGPLWYPAADSVLYLSIARSLAHGDLAVFGNPQIGFPPGYPLLLSPLFWISDRPFLWLSVLNWALAVVLMLGVHRWLRRRCLSVSVWLTGVVMLDVGLWVQYRRALSELAFMTVLVWAVQFLDQCVGRAVPGPGGSDFATRRAGDGPAYALFAAVLLLWASMIREVGAVFALAFVVALWLHRRDAVRIWIALPALAAVVAFVVREALVKVQSPAPVGTHLDALVYSPVPVPAQLVEGLRLRLSEVGRLLLPGMFKAYSDGGDWLNLNLAVYVPLCVVVAAGWWRLMKRDGGVFALGLPFYLAVYLAWPFANETRYLLPILPVLVCSLWLAIERLRAAHLLLVLLLLGHLGVALGQWLQRDLPAARSCGRMWDGVERIVAVVRAEPAAGAIMGTHDCVRQMLSFALDRPLEGGERLASAPAGIRWLVMSDGAASPSGFRRGVASSGLVLFVRDGER